MAPVFISFIGGEEKASAEVSIWDQQPELCGCRARNGHFTYWTHLFYVREGGEYFLLGLYIQ